MNEDIQNRLAALRDEYEKGRERLRELQRQQSQVEETLLRIEGAMTVLQEFLPLPTGQSQDAPPTVATRDAKPAWRDATTPCT
jgi:DNA repair exonuclease SbcCD ATPase subunit